MKIVAIRSYLKNRPLTKPYTIAYQTFSEVSIVYLEIELCNGMIGYGAASPAEEVVGENTATSFQNLQSAFVQSLVGRDIRHFQQIIFEAQKLYAHQPGTLAALDIALHDAFCKYIQQPIVAFYGPKMQALPTSITIGIKNLAASIEEAKEYQLLGFKILKIKTGLDLQEDIDKVKALSTHFGNSMKIRVDANQGYQLEDLQIFLHAIKNLDVELIEQPLPVGKEAPLLKLAQADRKILCGDESIKHAKAALEFANNQVFGIFNIKLMKCGGILGANAIAKIAYHGGIDLFWGCNDESIISISAALHAAYSSANTKYIDLDGSFDIIEDLVTGGFELKDGMMYLNTNPGLGVNIEV